MFIVIRCRIFVCSTCGRIIAGCLVHANAVAESIDSCAVCAQDKPKRANIK